MSIMFLYYSEEQSVKGKDVAAHTLDTNLISTGEFLMRFPSVQEHVATSCHDEFFKVWLSLWLSLWLGIDGESLSLTGGHVTCCSNLEQQVAASQDSNTSLQITCTTWSLSASSLLPVNRHAHTFSSPMSFP